MSSNGSSGGRFGFPFPSSVIPAFSHALDMAGGGGWRVVLSLIACQVVLKGKNHQRSGAGGLWMLRQETSTR